MKSIWILIYVHRGLIQTPELFADEQSALRRKIIIMKDVNDDYDEVDIFEKLI